MATELLFTVWDASGPPRRYPKPPLPPAEDDCLRLFLLANHSWNDYSFYTSFVLHIPGPHDWLRVGWVSIGFTGQARAAFTYEHLGSPQSLQALPADCFSLGEDLSYYETLISHIGHQRASEALCAVRDTVMGLSPDERERVKNEEVFQVSLLRSNAALEAYEQAATLFGEAGGPPVNEFTATIWMQDAEAPHLYDFDFSPKPVPSRISVLVGLNGTGKTQSMATLARLLSRVHSSAADENESMELDARNSVEPRPSVYGVVALSFSAFDDFVVPSPFTSEHFKYVYCGLNSLTGSVTDRAEIVEQEVASRFLSLPGEKRQRALRPLAPTLADDYDWDAAALAGSLPFSELSAGQRIVLSVTAELLQNVSRRVLVLMDEPEIHLHPQLLSGLLAWIEDLLAETDSFAIVATHSPIVVQQAIASGVYILRRAGNYPSIAHPSIETFGANLTEIVREVFEDRAGDRSYQNALDQLFRVHGTAEAVEAVFDGRLGLNAQIYLRSLELE